MTQVVGADAFLSAIKEIAERIGARLIGFNSKVDEVTFFVDPGYGAWSRYSVPVAGVFPLVFLLRNAGEAIDVEVVFASVRWTEVEIVPSVEAERMM